jgi:hypothetical protein
MFIVPRLRRSAPFFNGCCTGEALRSAVWVMVLCEVGSQKRLRSGMGSWEPTDVPFKVLIPTGLLCAKMEMHGDLSPAHPRREVFHVDQTIRLRFE